MGGGATGLNSKKRERVKQEISIRNHGINYRNDIGQRLVEFTEVLSLSNTGTGSGHRIRHS